MSRASCAFTPIAGITVFGRMERGARIHSMTESGTFRVLPATYARSANPASEGPTRPAEPGTPGIA